MRVERETKQAKTVEKKVMWNVTMLDCSGSMGQRASWGDKNTKIETAIIGIHADIKSMKDDKTGVGFKVAIVEFEGDWVGDGKHYRYAVKPCDISEVRYEGSKVRGNTPLYAALGDVIDDIIKIKPKEEPCIITVFTDGHENSSYGSQYNRPGVLKTRIDSAEKENISVKFIGTQQDVENMIKSIGIKRGNTFTHDNTERGITSSFEAKTRGTLNYTQSYAKGMSADNLTQMNFFSDPKDEKKDDKKS